MCWFNFQLDHLIDQSVKWSSWIKCCRYKSGRVLSGQELEIMVGSQILAAAPILHLNLHATECLLHLSSFLKGKRNIIQQSFFFFFPRHTSVCTENNTWIYFFLAYLIYEKILKSVVSMYWHCCLTAVYKPCNWIKFSLAGQWHFLARVAFCLPWTLNFQISINVFILSWYNLKIFFSDLRKIILSPLQW